MTRNLRIEAIEAAEHRIAAITRQKEEYRQAAAESDGIDDEEQAHLDRIDAKIRTLQEIVTGLRTTLERNRAIWEGRAGDLAQLRDEIGQLRALGLDGLDPAVAQLAVIDDCVRDQRWADATAALDRARELFDPVLAAFVAQEAAKAEYAPLRADFDRRLAAVRDAARPDTARRLASIDADLAEVDGLVSANDYVAAVAELTALAGRLQPLEEEIQLAAVEAQLGGGAASSGGASYEVGAPRRPTIRHDNGFRQNPADPNDPVPMPTRTPTTEEIQYYAEEVTKATGGDWLTNLPWAEEIDERLSLEHGIAGYRHFLTGGGADYEFDYEAYLEDDPAGRAYKQTVINGVQDASNEIYDDLGVELPETPGASVTFNMHGSQSAGGPPYPETEDWQKAIGGHTAWSNSEITLTRQADGTIRATATIRMEAEDRYNFNPSQADIATGVPDSERGRLEQCGLAHQFTQTGSAEFESSWVIGTPTTSVPGGGGGPSRTGG